MQKLKIKDKKVTLTTRLKPALKKALRRKARERKITASAYVEKMIEFNITGAA